MKTVFALLFFHCVILPSLHCQSNALYCKMDSFVGAHLPDRKSVERWSNEIENQFKEGFSIPHKVLSFLAFHWRDHLKMLSDRELCNLCKCIYVELFYSKPVENYSVTKLDNPQLKFKHGSQEITENLRQRTTAKCEVNGETFFLHECRKKNLGWNCYDIYVSFYDHDLRRFYKETTAGSFRQTSDNASMVAVAKNVKFGSLQH